MAEENSSPNIQHYKSPFLDDVDETRTTALVILNSPIRQPPSPLFQKLWDMSSIRLCADGGANRLYDATVHNMESSLPRVDYYIPDVIRGDLDSLRKDVRDYYETKGTLIEHDFDQDTNDLDKVIQRVVNYEKKESNNSGKNRNKKQGQRVFVYGAFGGRFDQEMASIQALYKWSATFHGRLYLYNDDTCAFLLTPNKRNEIRLPNFGDDKTINNNLGEGPTCGLVPVGCKCDSVRTAGLKWNVNGPLEFGGIVSTSNRVTETVVLVETSHPLVFTAEITCLEKEKI